MTDPSPATWLDPRPLPARRGLAHFVYGLSQPLLGLRVVLREPALRRAAATPVLLFAGFCALVALGTTTDPVGRVQAFITTLITFAPAPVVLFGKTYRRLAAAARVPLGLSPRTAESPGLLGALGDAIRQAILLAIGLVPIYLAFELFNALFPDTAPAFVWLAWALGGSWALHWIVIEALDNGHTVPAPNPKRDPAPEPVPPPDPWFVRIYQRGTLRRFAGLLRRLSRPWHRELDVIARYPELALGFGLGVAALLAVPFVALLFRPAAVIAAVHVLGRVDEATATDTTVSAPAAAPAPPVA